jgi:hypothetical protein
MIVLAAGLRWTTACNLVDDEPAVAEGGTDGPSDEQVCAEEFAALLEAGCPPGSLPQQHYDGGTSTVVLADDPGARVGLGVGLVVSFGGGAGADWVGSQVTQNSLCTTGCFAPSCGDGQYGCFAHWMSGALCSHYCSDEAIDQQACDELQQTCLGTDPGAGGTTGDDGGLDETGDEATGGGALDEPYDCGRWHPEAVVRPLPDGAFHVPQALVDLLVASLGDVLAECDGVRLRQGGDGGWVISRMRSAGLLGALGLRVGDELQAFDGVALDSLDALVGVLGGFVAEDGSARPIAPSHPGFSLRVRRGGQTLVRRLRVVPSTGEDGANGR